MVCEGCRSPSVLAGAFPVWSLLVGLGKRQGKKAFPGYKDVAGCTLGFVALASKGIMRQSHIWDASDGKLGVHPG